MQMHAFNFCTPEGKIGLVVCKDPVDMKTILEEEGIDTTQCTVNAIDSAQCIVFDTQTRIYTEKKPNLYYSDVEPPTSLTDDLCKLHSSGKGCDLVLKVDDNRIPCHKTVLLARSKYFEAMFSSAFSEESSQKEIEVEGFSFSMMDTIIKFMYTTKVNLPLGDDPDPGEHIKSLESILVVADYFDIPSLISYIEQEILEVCIHGNLSLTHVQALIDIYNTAGERGLRNLQKIAATYMPDEEALHTMELTESLQEDITSACLLDYQFQFYFGPNHELHELLESEDLSSKNIPDDIAKLEAKGADAVAIHAGHTCIRRMCAKDVSPQTYEKALASFLYFVKKRSYPMDSLDHMGQTMLHIAAVKRQVAVVQILIGRGASTNVSDAEGLPIARAVQAAFDREAARFVHQYLTKDGFETSPSYSRLREGFTGDFSDVEYKAGYKAMRKIHKLIPLYEHDWDSLSKKCMEALGIKLNEDFITEAATNYVSVANEEEIATIPAEYLKDKCPIKKYGYFSDHFLNCILWNRFPHFMTFMRQKQDVDINSAKQKIRKCLIRDITDGPLERRVKVCSVRHLNHLEVTHPYPGWLTASLQKSLPYYEGDDEYVSVVDDIIDSILEDLEP